MPEEHEIRMSIRETKEIVKHYDLDKRLITFDKDFINWVHENIGVNVTRWEIPMWSGGFNFINFYFENEEDAMAFKLMWKH